MAFDAVTPKARCSNQPGQSTNFASGVLGHPSTLSRQLLHQLWWKRAEEAPMSSPTTNALILFHIVTALVSAAYLSKAVSACPIEPD